MKGKWTEKRRAARGGSSRKDRQSSLRDAGREEAREAGNFLSVSNKGLMNEGANELISATNCQIQMYRL